MKKYDAIIIGSGIGGLISAGVLSAKGLRTLVLEKHSAAGGYLGSFKRKGFLFDSSVDCIAGLEKGGIIRMVLEMLGVDSKITPISLDPIRESIFPDYRISVFSDISQYKTELCELFYSEKNSINSFINKLESVYGSLQAAMNEICFGNNTSCNSLRLELSDYSQRSFSNLLDEYFNDYKLEAALSDRCPFIGLPPSEVSAMTMINVIMSYFKSGAFRPSGGFQQLADQFVQGIQNAGGDVFFDKTVSRIFVENNICTGVACQNGEEYFSDVIVSNADYYHTFIDLIGSKCDFIVNPMLKNPGVSGSFFILYAGVSGVETGASSIGYFPSYDMEGFFSAERLFKNESTLGFTIASIEDSRRAPSGFSTVVVHEMVPSNAKCLDKETCIENVIKRSEAVIKDFGKRIAFVEAATPATLKRYTNNYNGAAFGWRHVPGFRRVNHHGIKNLYIASHWGDFGGGVIASAYSGLKTASAILKKEGLTIGI